MASSATQARSEITSNGTAADQVLAVPNTDAANVGASQAATYSANGITLLDSSTMYFTKTLSAPMDTTAPGGVGSINIAFDVANAIQFNAATATTCYVSLGAVPSMTVTVN